MQPHSDAAALFIPQRCCLIEQRAATGQGRSVEWGGGGRRDSLDVTGTGSGEEAELYLVNHEARLFQSHDTSLQTISAFPNKDSPCV